MRALLLLLGLAAACGKDYDSTLDKVLDTGELVLGTEPEFPPFESRNEDGEFVGFDMDMARELAKDLGVKLVIEPMTFDALNPALSVGRVDLVISGMTATDERRENRAFSDPYYHTKLILLVHKDSGIAQPDDADGKRIVVKLGTTGEKKARERFQKATITVFDTEAACALEVVHGRADAFVYDRHSILRHARANPTATRVVDVPLSQEPYAMAARHGDDKWVARLNRFLKAFRADGRYAKLYEKHFGERPDEG